APLHTSGGKTGITEDFGTVELCRAAVNTPDAGSGDTNEPLPSAMDALRDDIAAGRKLVPPSHRPHPDLSEDDISGGRQQAGKTNETHAPAHCNQTRVRN